MIYDCFISYESHDFAFVQSIVAEIEKQGLQCWYAPRNVIGEYAKAITEAIENSRVFILILNDRSANSSHVLNEIEIAHNLYNRKGWPKIQPVSTMELDLDATELRNIMYYIRRIHFVYLQEDTDYAKMADKIIQKQPFLTQKSKERGNSNYIVQQIEDERLNLQNSLLEQFDGCIYQSVFEKYDNCHILDVGCGNGDMLVPRVKKFSTAKFIGLDINQGKVLSALEKYGSKEFIFFVNDVCSENFENELTNQMQEAGIEKFDVINLSMLLLHLKEPISLLKILRKFISEDGTIIIRDIDDGLNFAYPDPDNTFERIYKICEYDEQSGHRRNGRQIYHDLLKAGFSKIRLERQGLSSIGLNLKQKDNLFQMYFPFILANNRIMMEKNPWKMEYREDYLWFKGKYDSIYQQFMKNEFVFSLGFVSFTAQP